jgi:hypothetical protein
MPTLEFTGASMEVINMEIVAHLREAGWQVELPRDWEKPGQLAARLGVNIVTVSNALRHPACPPFAAQKSATGARHERVASTAALDAFITRNKANPQPQKARRGNKNRRGKTP